MTGPRRRLGPLPAPSPRSERSLSPVGPARRSAGCPMMNTRRGLSKPRCSVETILLRCTAPRVHLPGRTTAPQDDSSRAQQLL